MYLTKALRNINFTKLDLNAVKREDLPDKKIKSKPFNLYSSDLGFKTKYQ